MLAVREGHVVDSCWVGHVPHIIQIGGSWYREKGKQPWVVCQLLLPDPYHPEALELIHDNLWAGHQGVKNILSHLEKPSPRALLAPLPKIELSSEQIAMDFIGPFLYTQGDHSISW